MPKPYRRLCQTDISPQTCAGHWLRFLIVVCIFNGDKKLENGPVVKSILRRLSRIMGSRSSIRPILKPPVTGDLFFRRAVPWPVGVVVFIKRRTARDKQKRAAKRIEPDVFNAEDAE